MAIAQDPPRAHEAALLATFTERAFWWRALAVLVDVLVTSVVANLLNFVFGVAQPTSGPIPQPEGAAMSFSTFSATPVQAFWLPLVVSVYYVGLEGAFGATVGKWLVGLRVTTEDGRAISLWQSLVRNALRVVDWLPALYLVGGFAALSSPWRQRLGDRFAHTIVVPRTLVAPLLTPRQLRRRLGILAAVLVALLGYSAGFFYVGRPALVVESTINTRQMMFENGVDSYTLSAPEWGPGTVTYHIQYRTISPSDTCSATLTLRWTLPNGWQPGYGEGSCAHHTP